MPLLLRHDSIRLLEASVEALQLAVASLGAGKRKEFREKSAEYSIEVGLIGAAAELAMAACVVQASGPGAILWPSGQFKTAGQILEDFRDLVRNATINSAFLTSGVSDPDKHRQELLQATIGFRRLFPVRAGGLHAGRGLLHEAAVVQANSVADFLELLRASSRVSPYIDFVPRCPWYRSDRALIVEDIARRLRDSSGDDQAVALASLYVVLPDIPEDKPEWLDALQRVSISPREQDISFLLDTIEQASPAIMRRIGTTGTTINVAVRPDDPDALPIAPHFLKRQFSDLRDAWHADIATANHRLESGSLDLPPAEVVREVFAIGLDRSRVVEIGEHFGPHQTWPAILASLSVQGTTGPMWFLVRRTTDLGQLAAQLRRAAERANKGTQERVKVILEGIDTIRRNVNLPRDGGRFKELVDDISQAENQKETLLRSFDRNKGELRELPEQYRSQLEEVSNGERPVGPFHLALLEDENIDGPAKRYWSRILSEVSTDLDDSPALITVLGSEDLDAAYTAARKALRRIDFRAFGPPLEEQ
jgi:hypothetical protein